MLTIGYKFITKQTTAIRALKQSQAFKPIYFPHQLISERTKIYIRLVIN